MLTLFARAASLLLDDKLEDTAEPDVRRLLEVLGYAPATDVSAGDGKSRPDQFHRARLLKAASSFARIFPLAAPDAPGLFCFGAEFDPAIADPLHRGSPPVGVSGVGLSPQEAFQRCVGEGIEYLSQLQAEGDVLCSSGANDPVATLGSQTRQFVTAFSSCRTHPDAALSWHLATRLSDGSEVLLPADLCLRRAPGQREIEPPILLGTGSAAGTSWDAAALHGLLELIERDAASLWWRGGQRGRAIESLHEASLMADNLLLRLRQNTSARRRSWLLDITTDLAVPCVAALSCRPDGFGLAFGLAARPGLTAAVRSAILEMCQIELAQAVVEAKRRERGEGALNERDRAHLRRATLINADHCALLQPVSEAAEYLNITANNPHAVLKLLVDRLARFGIETFGVNLTRPRFAVPAARVMAPGLQLEPSEFVTARLANTILRTGGGSSHTGGLALL
jgi:ribosomal protein S12 methylthiotransferase accessory factor